MAKNEVVGGRVSEKQAILKVKFEIQRKV